MKNLLPTTIIYLIKKLHLKTLLSLHYQKILKYEKHVRWRHLLSVFQTKTPFFQQ